MTSNTVPAHIAIIMDGNGRWAKERGLPRTAGHKDGGEVIMKRNNGKIKNVIFKFGENIGSYSTGGKVKNIDRHHPCGEGDYHSVSIFLMTEK